MKTYDVYGNYCSKHYIITKRTFTGILNYWRSSTQGWVSESGKATVFNETDANLAYENIPSILQFGTTVELIELKVFKDTCAEINQRLDEMTNI